MTVPGMYVPHFHSPSINQGHFGSFPFLVIVNTVATDMAEQISVEGGFQSLGHLFSGVAG